MITVSYPKDISLLGNNVILDLTSDQYYQSPPVNFEVDLEFSSIPLNNDTLQLNFGDGTETLIIFFKSTPAGEGMWLFDVPGFGTTEEFLVNYFVPNWNSNLLLSNYWSVEYIGSDTVRVAANEAGSFYDFTTTLSNPFLTLVPSLSGDEGNVNSQLNIYLDLYFRKAGLTDWIKRVFRVPTNKGAARFYLNKLMSPDDVDLNLPSFNEGLVSNVTSTMLEYKVAYTELFSESLGAGNKIAESPLFRLLPGGVSEKDFASFDLESAISDDFAWLTNLPYNNRIFPDQQVYLHYMYGNNDVTRHLQLRLECSDGTETIVSLFENVNLVKNNIYRIPLHYNLAKAALNNSEKTIVKYEVFWAETAAPGEPIWPNNYSFEVDHDQGEFLSQILYQNSFGYFEIMAFQGLRAFKLENETDVVSKQTPEAYTKETRTTRNFNTRIRPYQVLDTGYKTPEEMVMLSEVLSSTEVYLVEDDYYRPIILKSGQKDLYDDLSGRTNSETLNVYDQNADKYYSNGRYSI